MKTANLNQQKPIEIKLCQNVLGLTETEAVNLINQNYCIPFVVRRDKNRFEHKLPTGHSYRVNLEIIKGKVVRAYTG